MIRPLLLLTAAAGLMALAACDAPSPLSKAQVGECYTVVGKGSLGEPKLGKVPCAEGAPAAEEAAAEPATEVAAAEPAVEGQAAAPVTTQTVASGVATTCVKVPVCAAPSGGASYVATSSVRPKVRAGKAAATRRHVASHKRSSHTYTSGGGAREYVGLGIDYASVGEEERVKTFASVAPTSSTASSSSSNYSQSSSSTYSSSSSASSASGYAYGAQGPCCVQGPCCAQPGRGAPGPHIPFDQSGFLTWPGKVAYSPR